MARTLSDSNLRDRAARGRLKARGKPYFRLIEEGLHLGYRKPRGRRGKPAPAGKWVGRHYDGGGDYTVSTIGAADDFSDADGVAVLSFTQAQNKLRELHVQRAHAAAGVAGPMTISAVLETYFEGLEGRGKSTANSRCHARIITSLLGDIEVAALRTKDYQHFLRDIAKTPARARTKAGQSQRYHPFDGEDPEAVRRRQVSANRVWTILRAGLNHAWRAGLIDGPSEWARVKPFKGVNAARVRYLTIAEARRLVNASDPEFRPLLQAALTSGCRYGELCRLTVGDFDVDGGTLAIRRSKSGKPRHVVLTEEGQAFFRDMTAGRGAGELMLRRAGGGPWTKSQQQRFMARACERARITPAIGIHGARHTWASLSVMAGVPLMVVAHNLGHRDTSMVQHHYGHLAPGFIADEIRKGAPRFGFKSTSNIAALKLGG